MGRMIDADTLNYVRVRIYHDDGTIGGYNAVVPSSEIKNAPTVELIQCKDCKYWQLEHYVGGQCMSCQMMNSDDVCPTEPTHFCGWAERKEE